MSTLTVLEGEREENGAPLTTDRLRAGLTRFRSFRSSLFSLSLERSRLFSESFFSISLSLLLDNAAVLWFP